MSGRDIPPELDAAVEKDVVNPFIALRIDLDDPVNVFTGQGTIGFEDSDGNVRSWLGAGEFGAIDGIDEATDGSATGIKATLLKVPGEFREDINQQAARGALMEVYVGALNETFQQVEGVAVLNKYRLDQYKVTDAGTTLSVEVSGESRAIDQRRPAIKRFTNEYHQRHNPADPFFEFVSQMTELKILWAAAEAGSGGVGGSGSYGGGDRRLVRSV